MLLTNLLSLPSYTSPDHLPSSDTAHTDLGPPMIITKKVSAGLATGQQMGACFQLWALLLDNPILHEVANKIKPQPGQSCSHKAL